MEKTDGPAKQAKFLHWKGEMFYGSGWYSERGSTKIYHHVLNIENPVIERLINKQFKNNWRLHYK